MTVKLTDLQLLYGVAGAREKFEDLAIHLIRSECPDAGRVRIVRGDGGIDAHAGSLANPAGVDVFQVKFFPNGVGESQKDQIRKSFKRAAEGTAFKAKSWTLCLPIVLSVPEKKWFEEWKEKQVSTGIDISEPWDATKLEELLYNPKNRGIKEGFFKEEHLQQIRDTHGTLEKLSRDFEDRVPPPVPLILDPRFQRVHAGRTHVIDQLQAVVEIAFFFHVYNLSPQTVQNWHVIADIVCADPSRIVDRATFPQLGEHRNNPFDTAILPTLHKPAFVYVGVKVASQWPVLRQLAGVFEHMTVTCRVISDNHISEDKPIAFLEGLDWNRLQYELQMQVDASQHAQAGGNK